MTEPDSPNYGENEGDGSNPHVVPTVLPVLSEAARDALNSMPLEVIGPEIEESMARERGANQTLIDYVTKAVGPQLHVLKEDNPLMTDEELGFKMAKASSLLTLYLLARQASIDKIDIDTGLIGPDDI